MDKNRILQPLRELMRPGNLVDRIRRELDEGEAEPSLQVSQLGVLSHDAGVVRFGSGNAQIDENGFTIFTQEIAASGDENQIKFISYSDGTTRMGHIDLQEYNLGSTATIYIDALDDSNTYDGKIDLRAYDDAGTLVTEVLLDSANTRTAIEGGLNIDYADSSGNVYTGSWTPATYNSTNIDSFGIESGYFMRVGNMVTCWGRISIDLTVAGSADFEMSIPVAATFAGTAQLAGFIGRLDGDFYAFGGGTLHANTSNNRAEVWLDINSTANHTYFFHFSYQI